MTVFEKGWRALAASAVLLLSGAVASGDFVTTTTPVHSAGTRAAVDLPPEKHMRNVGGSDGAGLCVPTSQEVAGRWQSIPELDGFQAWCRKRPGGSTPRQLSRDLPLFFASKGVTPPKYLQHEGGDVELLRKAIKTRRMVGITYAGCDPFYGSNTGIAHMVDCAHLDSKLGAIIDNNQPGSWRWMSDTQLINRWQGKQDNGRSVLVTDGRQWFEVGGGWLVVWLAPPPPPIDTTAKDYLPDPSVTAEPEQGGDPFPDTPPMTEPGRLVWDWRTAFAFPPGVRIAEMKPRMRYWVNDTEVDRRKAFGAIEDGGLSDDSEKAFVSFVASDAEKAKAAVAAIKQYSDKLHVAVFTHDSWVAKARLKAAVTAQLPAERGGKTVFSAAELTPENAVKAAKAALGIVDPLPRPVPEPTPVMPVPVPPPAPVPALPADAPPAGPPPLQVPVWALAVFGYATYRLLRSQP